MKKPKYDSLRVGIVCSRFNEFVVNALLDGAQRGLKARGVREKNIETHWVPGAFEIPVMARLMAVSQKFDALVALGAVIRGETAHFEYVAGPCAEGIMQVQLETLIPIGFGVLTVENVEQAAARSRPDDTNKGFEAAQVALDMIAAMRRWG
ncbi:MAG: 6,7-dimethyl-8-ribityllumazine synthase [Ilumatobacteraceae bacterium]|jgi:6,7-dimethyl-8-ribityllumazine synthase|nr:6,7-dimethyl-8-ribityllumazine synthase [Actinomycetota bacterium]NCZ55410.1 6,7-dimethyl-8-ribityllumazine synthase [Acidimicrobiia bacterium]NCX31659.1 6,7-dimethyl-8-ribityllumazine synthase [Actinomycetota bacterium]NCX59779.1 6,7-dimethyl-8-ribityllumazine synthase [Actinomycetota bacterium]NCZ86141.1 6,7-dimethyl-8-ribityllumazine synthase [Actinomycetota bacterium]